MSKIIPRLIKGELYTAKIKNWIASGIDDIPTEFLKILGGDVFDNVVHVKAYMYKEIYMYVTQEYAKRIFTQVVMIPISNKVNSNCIL